MMKTLLTLFLTALLPALLLGQPGTIDTSFGDNGHLYYVDGNNFTILKSTTQSTDKIVSAGNTIGFTEAVIKRFNLDGSLDNSFQFQQSSTYPFNAAFDIKALPDGKLLVMLLASNDIENDELYMNLVRLNADGSSDTTFDSPVIEVDFEHEPTLFVGNNGKFGIFSSPSDNTTGEATITLFLPSGALDTSFGNNGVKQFLVYPNPVPYLSFEDMNNALTTDGEGNFFFTYKVGSSYFITKTDINFDSSSIVEYTNYGEKYTLATSQFLYNIFSNVNEITVQRFDTATMTLDNSYGTQSIATAVDLDSNSEKHTRGVLQPDGRLLAMKMNDLNTVIVCFNSDGSLVDDFGSLGVMSYNYDIRTDEPSSAHYIDENQKLYMINVNDKQDNPSFMITRINLEVLTAGIIDATIHNYSVYPNPAVDLIYLPKDVQEISIMDMTGKVILNKIGRQESLEVSDLKSGVYILKIKTTNGAVLSRKVAKK